MWKNDILKTAMRIMCLSIIAKIISMVVKIILARILNTDAMTLYSLATPTMMLFITIAQLSLPTITTKLFADTTQKKQRSFTAIVVIALCNNILLFFILILFIPLISYYFFHDAHMEIVLQAIIPLLPIVTFSGILKGYYQGKQRYKDAQIAMIIEEVTRLAYILIFIPSSATDSARLAALAIHSITAGEIGTLTYLLVMLPRKKSKWELLWQRTSLFEMRSILELSFPISASRLFTTFTSFLEPIIINMQTNAIYLNQIYGIIHGYISPLIMIPNFISSSLSFYLLPSFINSISSNNYRKARKILLCTITISLCIALLYALILFCFPELIITIIYNKDLKEYFSVLRLLIFPLSLCCTQGLLSSCLIGINKSREAFIDSLSGNIIKLLCLCIFLPKFNSLALVFSILASSITTTILHAIRVYFAVFKHHV